MKRRKKVPSESHANPETPPPPLAGYFKDRQSLRTSFRLSASAEQALRWLADKDDITSKELIDSASRLMAGWSPSDLFFQWLADLSKQETCLDGDRKTYVVTKGALNILERISSDQQVSRDVLLDALLRYLRDAFLPYANGVVSKLKECIQHWWEFADKCDEAAKRSDTILGEYTVEEAMCWSLNPTIQMNIIAPLEAELRYWQVLLQDAGSEIE